MAQINYPSFGKPYDRYAHDYAHFLILTGEREVVSVSFDTGGREPYFLDDLYEDFGDIYVLETGPDRESQRELRAEADSIYN